MRAAIIGLGGPQLTPSEIAMLSDFTPAGIILFARNISDPQQVKALIAHAASVAKTPLVVMIDQEGGRVARLKPPFWRKHPPAALAGAIFQDDAVSGHRLASLNGALIGADCTACGIDVVCAPVLDRLVPNADSVIGDRAFSTEPTTIIALARAFADGLLATGVQPVGKHVPGHGQARCDSHFDLPVVTAQAEDDMAPFAALADLPWMMTAHILFPAWDKENPATLSKTVIQKIIREKIGFKNLLVSDDLAMHALRGDPGTLAQRAIEAGCDIVLPCKGDTAETRALLEHCPDVTPATMSKLDHARKLAASQKQMLDIEALAAERDTLMTRFAATLNA